MITNFMKTLIRNMLKNKGYSFINIAGLAIGMAVGVLVLLYVYNELTYDTCHKDAENIYRIGVKVAFKDQANQIATNAAPLGPKLLETFPEIESTARFREAENFLVAYKQKSFTESKTLYGDQGVFDVFTLKALRGNPKTFLTAPYTVVITNEMAEKYFENEDPIGKVLTFDDESAYTVTGVIEKMPENTHIKFDMLLSMETLYQTSEDIHSWLSMNYYVYIKLHDGVSTEGLTEKYTQLIRDVNAEVIAQMGLQIDLFLQPLRSIHLDTQTRDDLEPRGNAMYVWIFATIGAFIILIACINFMNLSTAQSAKRGREVGMKKVLGAKRTKLAAQFLAESLCFSLISLCFAILLIEIFLPYYNNLIAKELTFNLTDNWMITGGLLGLTLMVGLLSGTYPALFLSSYRPLEAIGQHSASGRGHQLFRNILVSVQYIVSITLICCTVIIYYQLHFMKHFDMGFDKEQVLIVRLQGDNIEQQADVFKSKVKQIPGVENAALSTITPALGRTRLRMRAEGYNQGEQTSMRFMEVDEDYLETLGIPVVAGRNFSKDFSTDRTSAALINETLAREIGFEDVIGKRLYIPDLKSKTFVEKEMEIIGIIKDFHYASLHEQLQPLFLIMPQIPYNLSVKIRLDNLSTTLKLIEQEWKNIEPSNQFSYFFFDDAFDRIYRTELRLSKVFITLTLIAIIVACLGLFGLASFAAEQRTKEIGIRKVLGASVSNIVLLMSKNLTIWVIIANIVAIPLAYYAMSKWLENFAYRIDLSPFFFLFSALLALFIAVLTVSLQAIKAAIANPVDSLRYE